MDARLAPEQITLRDAAAQAVDRLGPRTVNQLDDEERAAKLDAAITAAGWRELRNDGARTVDVAIVAEQLARGLADAPFLGPTLAAELRRLAALPASARAETIAFDGRAIDARGAAQALVTDGATITSAELTNEHRVADLTRRTAATGAPVPLGTVDEDARTRWEAFGLALTSADLVGTMSGAVDLASEYAKARRQYGTAIGSFQAVQHLLADALVATEGSRSAALHAAWAVDELPPADALAACAVAKAYCARAARGVCETAIQVHGGIGNTWDCLAHVYLRRALLSIDLFGGVGANLARILAHHGIGDARGLR